MRIAGQMKDGFFPFPSNALGPLASHLEVQGDPKSTFILDPCAGKGDALVGLCNLLGIPHENAYAVELNKLRVDAIKDQYPKVNVCGPSDFRSAMITHRSFGAVYLNPPFDHEYGGGQREELGFLKRAVDMLTNEGILILVCPLNVITYSPAMVATLDTWFHDVEIRILPEADRHYGECVVTGIRREKPLTERMIRMDMTTLKNAGVGDYTDSLRPQKEIWAELGQNDFEKRLLGKPTSTARKETESVYLIPQSKRPSRFERTTLTPEEICQFLDKSPLYARIETRRKVSILPPPLSINQGHTTLLLLSGTLDGRIPGRYPHVVRGYTKKVEKQTKVDRTVSESGKVTTKTTFSESPIPLVRAVWPDGTIRTFGETEKPAVNHQVEEVLIELTAEHEAMPEDME